MYAFAMASGILWEKYAEQEVLAYLKKQTFWAGSLSTENRREDVKGRKIRKLQFKQEGNASLSQEIGKSCAYIHIEISD